MATQTGSTDEALAAVAGADVVFAFERAIAALEVARRVGLEVGIERPAAQAAHRNRQRQRDVATELDLVRAGARGAVRVAGGLAVGVLDGFEIA